MSDKRNEKRKIIAKHANYLLEMMLRAEEMANDWLTFGAPHSDKCPECGKINFEDDESTYFRNRSGAMKDKSRDVARKFLLSLYGGDSRMVDDHINNYIREDRKNMKRN